MIWLKKKYKILLFYFGVHENRELRNDNKTQEVIDRGLKSNNNLEEENAPLHLVTNSQECSMSEPFPEAHKQENLPIQRSRSGDFGYNVRRFNLSVSPWSMERRSLTWDSAEAGKSEFQGILNLRCQCSEDSTSTSKLRLAMDKVRVVSLPYLHLSQLEQKIYCALERKSLARYLQPLMVLLKVYIHDIYVAGRENSRVRRS